jgi:hypothetical protein
MNPITRAGLRKITEDFRKSVFTTRVMAVVRGVYDGVLASAGAGFTSYKETTEVAREIVEDVEKELRRLLVGCVVDMKRDVYGNVQGIQVIW